ncbi:OPT/YSL family transporter [Myxococcota bacterium]|nr:OPT/YSL family transporter [Myxococcota bacterium]
MPLFQRPPQSAEELAACAPLAIGPEKVQEMDEETWLREVYRGEDVPQLTARAVLMGSVLGGLLAFTNLYIGLKTGWALGVAITACILSFALSNVLVKLGVMKTPLTILETNCMASAASSAGYSTGGTMVSAISALLLLSVTPENPAGKHLGPVVLVAWTVFLAGLGTVLAIPMKRNLINHERLRFPSGTAAAATLQSLYSAGGEAIMKARVLLGSAAVGAIFPVLIDLPLRTVVDEKTGEPTPSAILPADTPIFDVLPARGGETVDGVFTAFKPSDWTVTFDNNPVMIAGGMLVGLRVTFWMFVSAVTLAYVLGPAAYDTTWVSAVTGETVRAATAPYKAWKEIGLWFGAPVLVASGLFGFATQWRTILRALSSLGGGAAPATEARSAAGLSSKDVEVPMSWFVVGGLTSGVGVVAVAATAFEVPVHYGVLAVAMTFLLSLVACRATGESDITPVGAMGKLMQLTYGALIPQSTTANLMTAGITASAAGSAADLLNDLKSGYLLGADPRRQFIAQASGIFAGTLATVTGFYLLVPDATALTGVGGAAPQFPAPSAQAWRAVAEVFKTGLGNMHPMHQQAIVYGLGVGAVLAAAEELLPKLRRYLPSATGLGLGFILPFQYPFSMLLGAILAWAWTTRKPEHAEGYLVPVSSGVIAGVSIMGVLVAILNNILG